MTQAPAAGTPDAAEDPRYEAAIFPVFLLQTLAQVAASRGIEPQTLCRGLGFHAEDLDDPAFRVSYRQASLMIRRALQLVPGDGLGLAVGNRNVLGTLGLLGHAVSLCPTLGDAFDIGMRYQVVAGGITQSSVRLSGNEVWVEAGFRFPDVEIQVFAVEELFASLLVYGRSLVGKDFTPLRVELAYPAPAYAAQYGSLFGCPLRFGAEQNRCAIEARWLMHELPNHNPLALKQVLALLETEHTQVRQKLDLAATVERAIERALRRGPSLEHIAGELNMSSRTLRRRLGEQGLSFETLLNNVRRTRVMSLLMNPELPVERVAEQSGYADVRSFRRAFKRWTGVSPSEFRQ
ncbi:AraC family transcriptional regulator [Solimonas sp. K1W22B-7]|uniref:AraC family transcriptional regulator n=1 Tax=Solimonas sp. K1W22B-7 TaxID=2303331 RepID=UPI000E33460A|nr:AraC family transcriptional regulator [Solimonas sp. K1W22B-7]AXQ27454.1 AraC family transcriptional regulator [Solimonas sp. K1W22B-7]